MTKDSHKSRNLSLDAVAGFFILLMMFQHFNINTRAPFTIGHIFMFNTSWFFFKSGMFHRQQKFNGKTIVRCFKRFIVPFIIFSFAGCTIQMLVSDCGVTVYYGMVAQIVHYGSPWYNIPLWFLLTLFIVKMLTVTYSGKNGSTAMILLSALAIAASHHWLITDRFNYIGNTALAVIFYIIGYKSNFWTLSYARVATIAILFTASVFIVPTAIDIWGNTALYGNYFLAIFGSVCGIMLVNWLFSVCQFLHIRTFVFFGRNSMVFLICHVPIALAVRDILSRHMLNDYLIQWIGAATSILVSFAICLLFDHHPRYKWIIGA